MRKCKTLELKLEHSGSKVQQPAGDAVVLYRTENDCLMREIDKLRRVNETSDDRIKTQADTINKITLKNTDLEKR